MEARTAELTTPEIPVILRDQPAAPYIKTGH